jgi:hypothetical protein
MAKKPRNYAEQTHSNPYWLIRYPHQKRATLALNALLAERPHSLLDYGAGDGHLISKIMSSGVPAPARIVAYEPIADMREHLKQQLNTMGGETVQLVATVSEALAAAPKGGYDAVACLGVLEHMGLEQRRVFIEFVIRGLSRSGRCVIDVPVEIGTSLLIKEFGRRVLKGRPNLYRGSELVMAAAGAHLRDPQRYEDPGPCWIQNHRGFDYRLLRRELEQMLEFIDTKSSPLPQFPPWLCNQEVLWTVRPRNQVDHSARCRALKELRFKR